MLTLFWSTHMSARSRGNVENTELAELLLGPVYAEVR
jgi:hypothetical protein